MYGLVDCNNFYVSCERVFNPILKGQPVVVLSNNDGCIIARSNEAKALGIPMGGPLHLFKKLIDQKNVFTYSSNYTLYGDMSARVLHSGTVQQADLELSFPRRLNHYPVQSLRLKQLSLALRLSLKIVGPESTPKVLQTDADVQASRNILRFNLQVCRPSNPPLPGTM